MMTKKSAIEKAQELANRLAAPYAVIKFGIGNYFVMSVNSAVINGAKVIVTVQPERNQWRTHS